MYAGVVGAAHFAQKYIAGAICKYFPGSKMEKAMYKMLDIREKYPALKNSKILNNISEAIHQTK